MNIICSMGGCGSTSFISWFSKRITCNCPLNSEGLAKPGPGANPRGLKHRIRPPRDDDPWLPQGNRIDRSVFLFDSPLTVIPSLFRQKIAVGHAIAISGVRPNHENDLERFLTNGSDSFSFYQQFEAWTSRDADTSYPRLIVRSSLIWSNLQEVFDFLQIPSTQLGAFPPQRPRHSSFDMLPPEQRTKMKEIYEPLDLRIREFGDITLL